MRKLRNWLDTIRILFTTFLALLFTLGMVVVIIWFVDGILEVGAYVLGFIIVGFLVYLFYCIILLVKRLWEKESELQDKKDKVDKLEQQLDQLR